MGEVWRARDTKLARDVALKILPDGFARDPDRLARFQREAQVLASLNHPNIAAIHGLEESSGVRALVLELVDGPTLADRIAHGTIPLDEALPIAEADRRSASSGPRSWRHSPRPEAVQHHSQGRVGPHPHALEDRSVERKTPLRMSDDIVVKVLDFGLAKALEPTLGAIVDVSQSPTITSPAFSGAGVILGTAAYMAPEQARGKAVDKRADIWAFGVVLYEMLTGKRPFRGDTTTDILAAVVGQEPDWTRVPAITRRLLRGCLQKDPKDRLHDIADMKLLLEEAPQAEGRSQPRLAWIAASALAVATSVALWAPWRTTPIAPEAIRTHINLPENVDAASRNFTLSPDGRVLAFSAVGPDGSQRVWVRFLDSLEVRELPGTEGLNTSPPLFLVSRQPVHRLCRIGRKAEEGGPVGGAAGFVRHAWPVRAGRFVESRRRDCVRQYQCRAVAGFGERRRVFSSHGARFVPQGNASCLPHVPPGRASFSVLRSSATMPQNSGVYLGSLDAKPEEQDSRRLVATTFGPVYVPSAQSNGGYVLIVREGTVLAYAFDEGRMDIVGDPVTVVQQVGAWVASGFFSATERVLIYRSSGAYQDTRPQWWDRRKECRHGAPERWRRHE